MLVAGVAAAWFASGAGLRFAGVVMAVLGAYTAGRRRRRAAAARPAAPAAPVAPEPAGSPLEQAIVGVHTGFGAIRTVLWRVNPADDRAMPFVVVGGKAPPPVRLSGDVLGWAAREGTAVRLTEAPHWAMEGAASAIAGAIAFREPMLFTAEFLEPATPSTEEFDRVAAYVRAVLELRQQEESAAAVQHRMEELLAALRRMPAELDPQKFAHELATTSAALAGCRGAAVGFWDGEQGRVAAVTGEDGPAVGAVFTALETESALAARGAATIVRADRTRSQALPIVSPTERWYGSPRSAAAVPLIANGAVHGVIAVWNDQSISDAAVHDLEVLAPYAALQLLHARDFGEMRQKAQHDRLTGLNNRQRFDERIAQEAMRFHRYGSGYALLLIDVDHFKSFNDTYGHQAGDAVLQEVARSISASLREVDFAARYGGEEFAVIAPETNLAAAVEIGDRIRTRIMETEIRWEGEPLHVTASIGVSCCPECGSDVETLIRAADQALYTSKNAGRNRVTAAPARIDPVRRIR